MKKFIGDREFYRRMLAVMLPVLAQNVITNFVSLLDNIMVGRVGTEQMSGVAIVNQLLFVFNLVIFGGLAGAGIFTAQYYGKGDEEGIRNTMRAKGWIAIATVAIGLGLLLSFGEQLISLYINKGEDDIDLVATLNFGKQYLAIMMFQMPLFAIINVYASTLRETGNTKLPMRASVIAVCVNLVFNYVLIYGKFGAPRLEVRGAAYATVLARIVEACIVVFASRFKGVWKSMHVPGTLAKQIAVKGLPLLLNELLWSGGMTTLIQIMSRRGVEVVTAENITNTIANLFFCTFFAMGATITIMVGALLGAGKLEQAVDEDKKLIAFSVAFSTAVGLIMLALAPFLPRIYNTTDTVKTLATTFIIMNALFMPSNAFIHGCYFTMRSGGRVWITMLYDSVYIWIIGIPLTSYLTSHTALAITWVYFFSYAVDLLKCVLGYFLIKSRTWVNNLVED